MSSSMYRGASGLMLSLMLAAAGTAANKAESVTVTILSSNLEDGATVGEWGFSALVEVDGRCVLFDAGRYPDTVLRNAAALEQVQRSIQDQPIQALMGGMHLFAADDATLEWTAERLRAIGLEHLMAGHCTGIEPMVRLREGLYLTRKTAVVGAVGSRFVYGEEIYPTSIAQ